MAENKENREPIGFLLKPKKISLSDLDPEGFLLPKTQRVEVQAIIRANQAIDKELEKTMQDTIREAIRNEKPLLSEEQLEKELQKVLEKLQEEYSNNEYYLLYQQTIQEFNQKKRTHTVLSGVQLPEVQVYIDNKHEAYAIWPKELGAGSFGTVYLAQNCKTGQWVCMKQLKSGKMETVELETLKQEGMYKSSQRTPDADLLITELIQGENLADFLKENPSLSFEHQLALIISLTEANESLARKGQVHRDIKPANIMTDGRSCVTIDFGLVTTTSNYSNPEKQAGSPGYMAPEINSKFHIPDISDDIYSIGLTAAEILFPKIDTVTDMITDDKEYKMYVNYLRQDPEMKKMFAYLSKSPGFSHSKSKLKKLWNEPPPELELKKDKNFRRIMSSDEAIFIFAYSKCFPIALGATNQEYQKQQQLTPQQIALCKLLYKMFMPVKQREKSVENVSKQLYEIRLAHITEHLPKLSSPEHSKLEIAILKDLFKTREKLTILFPHLVNDLDIFLLRGIDKNIKNRPSIDEMEAYEENFNKILQQKKSLVESIEKLPTLGNKDDLKELIEQKEKIEQIYLEAIKSDSTLKNKILLFKEKISKYLDQPEKTLIKNRAILQESTAILKEYNDYKSIEKITNQKRESYKQLENLENNFKEMAYYHNGPNPKKILDDINLLKEKIRSGDEISIATLEESIYQFKLAELKHRIMTKNKNEDPHYLTFKRKLLENISWCEKNIKSMMVDDKKIKALENKINNFDTIIELKNIIYKLIKENDNYINDLNKKPKILPSLFLMFGDQNKKHVLAKKLQEDLNILLYEVEKEPTKELLNTKLRELHSKNEKDKRVDTLLLTQITILEPKNPNEKNKNEPMKKKIFIIAIFNLLLTVLANIAKCYQHRLFNLSPYTCPSFKHRPK